MLRSTSIPAPGCVWQTSCGPRCSLRCWVCFSSPDTVRWSGRGRNRGVPAGRRAGAVPRPCRPRPLALPSSSCCSVVPCCTAQTISGSPASFFGVPPCSGQSGKFHVLMHGVTTTARSIVHPTDGGKQTTYYHRDGPLGQLFSVLGAQNRFQRVASVGLAQVPRRAIGRPGRNGRSMNWIRSWRGSQRTRATSTFLPTAPPTSNIVIGDGRQSLRAVPDRYFDLIMSTHSARIRSRSTMITREALALYVRKLRPGAW